MNKRHWRPTDRGRSALPSDFSEDDLIPVLDLRCCELLLRLRLLPNMLSDISSSSDSRRRRRQQSSDEVQVIGGEGGGCGCRDGGGERRSRRDDRGWDRLRMLELVRMQRRRRQSSGRSSGLP